LGDVHDLVDASGIGDRQKAAHHALNHGKAAADQERSQDKQRRCVADDDQQQAAGQKQKSQEQDRPRAGVVAQLAEQDRQQERSEEVKRDHQSGQADTKPEVSRDLPDDALVDGQVGAQQSQRRVADAVDPDRFRIRCHGRILLSDGYHDKSI